MAYIFLAFAHAEAIAGGVALATLLVFFVFAGQNREAMPLRIAAGAGGIVLYLAVAATLAGAGDYVSALDRAVSIGRIAGLLVLPCAAGVGFAWIVVRAPYSETDRRIAMAVCCFVSALFVDGYLFILRTGIADHVLPLVPFILFTGFAVTAGLLMLYRPSE